MEISVTSWNSIPPVDSASRSFVDSSSWRLWCLWWWRCVFGVSRSRLQESCCWASTTLSFSMRDWRDSWVNGISEFLRCLTWWCRWSLSKLFLRSFLDCWCTVLNTPWLKACSNCLPLKLSPSKSLSLSLDEESELEHELLSWRLLVESSGPHPHWGMNTGPKHSSFLSNESCCSKRAIVACWISERNKNRTWNYLLSLWWKNIQNNNVIKSSSLNHLKINPATSYS